MIPPSPVAGAEDGDRRSKAPKDAAEKIWLDHWNEAYPSTPNVVNR